MAGATEVLLHGEFGSGGPGGARYALTLTRAELHVQRLSPRPEGERRLVLPLCHVLECRTLKGRRAGPSGAAAPTAEEEAAAEGESEAGHFALYCYPPRKRRVGAPRGGRQRLVRVFRADGGSSREENRALAERWANTIKCLLLGVRLPGESDRAASTLAGPSPCLLPRRRRLLFFVNPRSGRSLAMSYCENHILPMIQEANISYNLICTEYQNHAREIIQQIKLSEWDGIVIVSGDGLVYEVINGLMERPDWELAIQMPVGILPAGSGNALAAAINHNAGYGMAMSEELLVNCILLLCRGLTSAMDLVSVTTASGRRHFSFLSVAWGFVADVDIESEKYRSMGAARFSVGTLMCLASLRRYRGRLSYLPAACRPRRLLCRSVTTSGDGLPPSNPPPAPRRHPSLGRALSEAGLWRGGAPDDSPSPFQACESFSFEGSSLPDGLEEEEGAEEGGEADPPARSAAGTLPGQASGLLEDALLPPLDQPLPPHWETVEGDFVLVLAVYQTHLGADLMAAPFARFAEHCLHLCYVKAGISRRALLRLFLAMEKGTHFALDCPHLFCVPALAFRLEPLTARGIITVDGERVEYGPLQAQVHGGLARLITGVPANTNGL